MKFFSKNIEDKMVELEEIKEYQESQKEERNRKLQNHHTLWNVSENGMRHVIQEVSI